MPNKSLCDTGRFLKVCNYVNFKNRYKIANIILKLLFTLQQQKQLDQFRDQQSTYINYNNINRSMNQYRLSGKKGDGTFSQVFKASSITTGKLVAIKCMKKVYDSVEKVKKLPEIQALKILSPHQNIIKLIQVLYDDATGKLALVFELMDLNLYECLINNRNLNIMKIKYYMYGLLKAISFSHHKGIFHRDIKPENVLICGDQIKLADFGSCKNIHSKLPFTEYISTRWYRAPECLLTDGYYNHKMDIWGYGCVLFQMISRYPLFNGKSQMDQIHKINKILGTPSDELLEKFKVNATHLKPQQWKFQKHKGISFSRLLPHSSKELIDLLNKLLAYDPNQRIEAQQALAHPYFQNLQSAAKIQKLGTTFYSKNPSNDYREQAVNNENENKLEKNSSKVEITKASRKKQRQTNNSSLPPIIQSKFQSKLNSFNETATSKFKKTGFQTFKKKF